MRKDFNGHRRAWAQSLLGAWEELPIGQVFNGLVCVIIVRTIFEAVLEDHSLVQPGMDFYPSVVAYAHAVLSWLCLFGSLSLIVSILLQFRLSVAFKLVVMASPLINIVPFIDYFISDGSQINYGKSFADFTFNFVQLFNPFAPIRMVSTGVRVEVFAATIGAFCLSCFIFEKGVLRSFVLALSIYLTIFLFGYLPALFPQLVMRSYLSVFPLYLPVFMALAVLMMAKLAKESRLFLKIILHLLFPSRLLFYGLLLFFGTVFTSRQIGTCERLSTIAGCAPLAIALISIALLFVYAKIQNDFYDRAIDIVSDPNRPVIFAAMQPEHVRSFKNVFLLPSFIFGLAAGPYFFAFWLMIFALSALYSEPPMRLRRYYPISNCLLAMVGAVVFLSGTELAAPADFFLTKDVPSLFFWIFLAFFCISHVKDFKDIDGDLADGVANVFNLTVSPKSIGIAAICGFSAVLIVIFSILGIYRLLTVLITCAYVMTAVAAIWRSRNIRRLDWLIGLTCLFTGIVSAIWLFQ